MASWRASLRAETLPVTYSRRSLQPVSGMLHFEIDGYSLGKGMGVGNSITSDAFTVQGLEWVVHFYPDGRGYDAAEYVALYVKLATVSTGVRAVFELRLLDRSGEGKHRVWTAGPHTFQYPGSMNLGWSQFFKKSELEESDFLKDDRLTFICTLGVVTSSTEKPKLISIPLPDPNLGIQFGELLNSGANHDAIFEVQGEKFRVHKVVLAARSPVFQAEFFGPMQEIADIIRVQDMEAPIFKAMLRFIYTDSIPDQSESSGSSFQTMAQQLLAAADRYGLDRLRLICESMLCEEIDVNTVTTILCVAEQHHASRLKDVCLKFAATNIEAIIKSDGYEYLQKHYPSLQDEVILALKNRRAEQGY